MQGRIFLVIVVAVSLWLFLGSFELDLTFVFGIVSFYLVSGYVLEVFRGHLDYFDPAFLFSLWVLFFLLISPVSQLEWDFWPFLPSMDRDRGWVYLWSFLNFVGVVIFILSMRFSYSIAGIYRTRYSFNSKRFLLFGAGGLVVCFLAQVYVYAGFGGISGFIAAFGERQALGVEEYNPFKGYGAVMLLAESFKIIFPMMVVFYFRDNCWFKSERAFLLFMVVCLFVSLYFGGVRGSRSSTLFSLFFAAGMYHFYIRRIGRSMIMLGGVLFIIFSSVYYWYKIAGVDGLTGNAEIYSERENVTQYLVVRDLGRMDIQSLALKRYLNDGYDYSLGRTYLVSIFSAVPKQLVPFTPDQITKEKTDILYGEGWYSPGSTRQTTLVMGQFGESFVNFGVFGVFLFFSLLGIWSGRLRRVIYDRDVDVLTLLVPFASLTIVLLLITDMNVVLYQLVRYLLLPVGLALMCLTKEAVHE